MADRKTQALKIGQRSLMTIDSISDDGIFSPQTLGHSERRPARQNATGLYQESETTLPDLQEYSSIRHRGPEDDDSDGDECFEPLKQPTQTSRIPSAKVLPRISDPRRPRRAFFSECQSLYDKIKSTCTTAQFNGTRRLSYCGINGEDTESLVSAKPSVQGTAILRKGRGEKAQLIDADDFFVSTKDNPIQRVLDFKKPNLTPWNKSKPLTGRPQSGQPRFSKKFSTDYGTIDMACIGSKIQTDLTSTAVENKSQKTGRKLRNLRAKSASLVEKSM